MANKCPRTTHTWLKPLYDFIDLNVGTTEGAAQTISTPGATPANVTTGTTRYLGATAGNNITSTLANGTYLGQRKTLVLSTITSAKTAVITPTTFADGTTITLAAALDSVTLEWQTGGWIVISQSGTPVIA